MKGEVVNVGVGGGRVIKVKMVKVVIYRLDIPEDFTSITPRYWNSLFNSLVLLLCPRAQCSTFSAAEAIHAVPIFVPPGTHYYWVGRVGVDSKLGQCFYTSELRESNPLPIHLWSKHSATCSTINCNIPKKPTPRTALWSRTYADVYNLCLA